MKRLMILVLSLGLILGSVSISSSTISTDLGPEVSEYGGCQWIVIGGRAYGPYCW